MNYTQAAGEKSTVKLTITFTEEEWQDSLNKAYLKVRGKYTVPGFRKGKAPKPVLENYYGKSVLFEEAFNYLYSNNYYGILEKEKDNFTAVGEPTLDIEDMPEGNGLVMSALVPVKPDVTIDAYTGLKIKKFEYNVSDADVDREVSKIVENAAVDEEVTDRPCKAGDTVNIDFSGSVDGEVFPGGTAEDYNLVLGSHSFIPGFEEAVEGMNIGEDRNINVKFPQDYQVDNLKGKDAVFKIKLHKITQKKYPELTDELVKAKTGTATLEEYRKKIFDRLDTAAKNKSRDDTENSIISEISKHAHTEIPDAMIENEIDGMVQSFSYRLMGQGIKLEEYLKYMQLSMEQFRSQFRQQAEERALSQLVVDKIVKTENLKAEDAEIEAKIEEQAKSVEKTAEEYKKNMDPRQRDYIISDIVVTKLFDFLTKNNELYTEDSEKSGKSAAKESSETAEKPAKKPAAKKTAAKKAENKD